MLLLSLILVTTGFLLIISKSKLSYMGNEMLVFVISIPALFFIPKVTDDLYRYFISLNELSSYNNFYEVIAFAKYDNILRRNSESIIFNLLEWIVSRTDVFTLLPFIVVFIVYSCLSIPNVYQINKFNVPVIKCFLITFSLFMIFPYLNTLSTLRWGLASAMFFIITYFYCNYRENNSFIVIIYICLYGILYFIHEAFLLPAIISVICILHDNIKVKKRILFVFILLFMVIIFTQLKGEFITKNLNIFLSYKNELSNINHFSILGKLNSYIPFIVSFLYDIGCILILIKNKEIIPRIYFNMFISFNIMWVLFFPLPIISQRYTYIVDIIDVICYMEAEKINVSNVDTVGRMPKLCFYLSSIVLLIININGVLGMNFSNEIVTY